MLNLGNFVQTTLAAPVTTSSLQLILQDASAFNIPAGDYCYITVIDGATVEIMRYTSGGAPVNNTISVSRGQDGTTAKAFPVGACVKVAWNVAQLTELVEAVYNQLFDTSALPANTQEVTAVPTAPPSGSVIYSVWVAKKRFWFWDVNSPGWIELGNSRDGVLVSNTVPVVAPDGNVAFCVVTSTASLYYWNGSAWVLVSGTGTGREILARASGSGQTASGTAALSANILDLSGLTFSDLVSWRENPALASCLSINGSKQFVVSKDCLVRVTAQLGIGTPSPAGNNSGTVAITVSAQGRVWTFDGGFVSRSGDSQTNKSLCVTSPTIRLNAGDLIAASLILDGSNAQTLVLSDAFVEVEVVSLL